MVYSIVGIIGPVELLVVAAGLCVAGGGLAWWTEHALKPAPRPPRTAREGGIAKMLGGARVVLKSRYLLLLVGIVLAYEFASATTDFTINVIFQRSFTGEVELAQMSGRLGWVVSATALISQIVLVPLILPHKRVALLLPPLLMVLPTLALAIVPLAGIAFLLGAADRGMNYSVQQVTKETLYVPLGDVQKYKAKAFIDMLVDRGGKAISSIVLMVIIAAQGVSLPIALAVAIGAMIVWTACAFGLGRSYERGEELATSGEGPAPASPATSSSTTVDTLKPHVTSA
jgi:ATP:ADP antiporter, AAA family